MKLKRPPITQGPWNMTPRGTPTIWGQNKPIAVAYPKARPEEDGGGWEPSSLPEAEANGKAMSSLPEVMDLLEKIHFATGNWDYEDLRPDGIKRVHVWSHEAMLKLGYTEEAEVQVTEAQSKPESET